MSTYFFNTSIIGRAKGGSIGCRINYIFGKRIKDCYNSNTYYKRRSDIAYSKIFLPEKAPEEFKDLQTLCDRINKMEKRRDAQTAREIIAALPNELPLCEQVHIVDRFLNKNFINKGFCAVAAIHKGENELDPSRNNPHVHILIPFRTVDEYGFSKKKVRSYNNRKYLEIWREQWAREQNRSYERYHIDAHVSHESFRDQGIPREPLRKLDIIDWNRELRGEHTPTGDLNREIMQRNEGIILKDELRCKFKDMEKSHDRIL